MSPYSDKSKEWRKKYKQNVKSWRNQIAELRNLANLENWSYERLEMEIAQKVHPKLRKVYDFALQEKLLNMVRLNQADIML